METNEVIKLLLGIIFIFLCFYIGYNVYIIKKTNKYGHIVYDNIYRKSVEISNKSCIKLSIAFCVNICIFIAFFML